MPIPQPALSGTRRDFMIEHLLYNAEKPPTAAAAGQRMVLNLPLPPWQRGEVWTQQQKSAFIEGIFLGFGTGFYVVNGKWWLADGATAPCSGWLLDGQQRMTSIRDFLAGEIVVFGDVTFPAMTGPEAIRFRHTLFPCVEIEYTDDENKLRELYDRLNFSGTPHTPSQRAATAASEPNEPQMGPG